ncbi:dihydrofolate reductase family protein [Amycolatopsis sp. NBC_01488]|uniref:dihydrofolate reductase family protein n=1 Tax=Amycolatopsis sp. NBC_01488 TaxID=2903563 RepID=UPI002E2D0ED3|nr:dihydrofolate reductase family protein [Amycolatopsis sp. NBC_01488]
MSGAVQVVLSMSLDGFITGKDPTVENPLGDAGDIIRPGGERWMRDETMAAMGAVVAGRTVYDHTHGWGDEPPFEVPVFVPTHRPRDVRVAGATTFTFVPDVKTAVTMAKEAAGDKNVYLMGGANTANQALRLGLVDELILHIEPVLLGAGARLFADLGDQRIPLERVKVVEGEKSTHVWLRVLHA